MSQNPLNKKTHPEPRGGWTKDDRTPRCVNCGEPDQAGGLVGTPLSEITVKVMSSVDPFIDVAKAAICRHCHRVYHVKLLRGASGLNINLAGVEACLKATENADSFKINELQSGRVDHVELSQTLQAIIAKRPPRPAQANPRTGFYNPDAFTEQKQEVLF